MTFSFNPLKFTGIILLIYLILAMQAVSISQSQIGTNMVDLPVTKPAELLERSRTRNFVEQSRSIGSNNASSIDQIYYRLASLYKLDPTLSQLDPTTKQQWIDQTLVTLNPDGGFGNWEHDRSGLTSTNRALHILNWTSSMGLINTTQSVVFLESLRNSLTGGYKSNSKDPDSDVYSTYLGTESYDILGVTPVNENLLRDLFVRAQNNNANFVPPEEIGGFGKQTNNIKDIYWTSEATITRAALIGLQITNGLGMIDVASTASFIESLQIIEGGFTNDKLPLTSKVTTSYTTAAIEAAKIANASIDTVAAQNYLHSLGSSDGGFRLSSTSSSSSLLATYFAIRGLIALGDLPANVTKTVSYLLEGGNFSDGFGSNPGADPSLRETFGAVYALDLGGSSPVDKDSIINYVNGYRNPDGGYGLTGSYTESTYRAVSIYDILDVNFPDPVQTISFLQGLQMPDGGFSKGEGQTTSYVVSTYRAIATLNLLNATPSNPSLAITYMKNNQNTDGGYGGYVGDTSDISSTYRAVRSIILLGGTVTDTTTTISFLKNAQNPDGGFRRSPLDITLPNNVSSAVFSYSAFRTLKLLDSAPSNMASLWDFLVNIRNSDGGYGLRIDYTSDVAYTFTSLWMIKYFHEVSGFKVQIPSLDTHRNQYNNFALSINGGIQNYTLSATINNQSGVLSSVLMQINTTGDVTIDTSDLSIGRYDLTIEVIDQTGAIISYSGPLEIFENIPSNFLSNIWEFFEDYQTFLIFGAIVTNLGLIYFIRSKRRSRK